jgi:hypothetical protein
MKSKLMKSMIGLNIPHNVSGFKVQGFEFTLFPKRNSNECEHLWRCEEWVCNRDYFMHLLWSGWNLKLCHPLLLVCCWVYFLSLKIYVICSSETLGSIQTTVHYIPEYTLFIVTTTKISNPTEVDLSVISWRMSLLIMPWVWTCAERTDTRSFSGFPWKREIICGKIYKNLPVTRFCWCDVSLLTVDGFTENIVITNGTGSRRD